MSTHTHRIIVGALAITGLSLVVETAPGQDVTFPLFMLGGPVVTGLVLGARWRHGAAAWAAAAVIWLVLDWAINHEDVTFHAVIAVVFTVLVALGAGLARLTRRTFAGT
jgi:hypothetical protein